MQNADASLTHYGIPGMKWGVRRATTSIGNSIKKAKAKRAEAKNEKKSIKKLTNEQLKAKINRLQLEQQYKSLTQSKVSSGKQMITKALKNVGSEMLSDVAKNAAGYGINTITGKEIFKTRYGSKK